MKYLIDALKYLKSNLLLLPSLAVAILAFAPIIDYTTAKNIVSSFTDGTITSQFTAWLKLFLPFNTENWLTIVLSIVAYIALVLDVAFIHSMVDKHIRFGSKSFRSIMSSFTINFIYGLITMVVLAVAVFILALLMALIMSAFALTPPYVFIVGIVLCVALDVVAVFIAGHFFLWLPCTEITGFKMGEALYSSYAQAKTIRWRNFVAIGLPLLISFAVTIVIFVTLGQVAGAIAGSICFGCAFMVIIVASYMAYADAEGIEREDLKKY